MGSIPELRVHGVGAGGRGGSCRRGGRSGKRRGWQLAELRHSMWGAGRVWWRDKGSGLHLRAVGSHEAVLGTDMIRPD